MRAMVIVILAASATAHADVASHDAEARALFDEGRQAYERNDFPTAHERFRRAYLLSGQPALLFNMSAALREGGRPHEAAEALRSYLRVVPDEPDRDKLEREIRALEEKQKLLDDEERARHPPPTVTPAVIAPPSVVAPPPIYKRWWLWTAIGVVVAGAAIAVAIVLSPPSFPSTPASDGTVRF